MEWRRVVAFEENRMVWPTHRRRSMSERQVKGAWAFASRLRSLPAIENEGGEAAKRRSGQENRM